MILPTKAHLEWADCEMGVIIHFDMSTFDASYDWNTDWFNTPPPEAFNPDALSVDQWMEVAAAAGAKYAVMVAKHCSGFCLWPTKVHNYHIGNSPYKGGEGDLIREFMNACAKYGIKPGLYYSANYNSHLGASPERLRAGTKKNWTQYYEVVMAQLRELWTNYGQLFEIWFDGGVMPVEEGGPDIAELLHKLQPEAVVFQGPPGAKTLIRWVGNERAEAPENCSSIVDYRQESFDGTQEHTYAGSTFGNLWCPGESDMPNREATQARLGGWFWAEGEEHLVFPGEELFQRYLRSVGRNSNLLIGMAINPHGLFTGPDEQAFRTLGALVKQHFSEPLLCASVVPDQTEYLLEVSGAPKYLVLAEDIAQGERITKFCVEHIASDGATTPIYEAQIVGHKRIVPLEGIVDGQIRFTVVECKAAPQMKTVALY